MATVTGLTAARMLAIEAASVVDGEVVGDNLILTKHDSSTINAGNVRGPQGDQGPVGSDLAVVTARDILEVGVTNQIRAGRQLSAADFTNMGLSAPLGLWNLGSTADASGNGRTLTNKGTVTFDTGINGAATSAARFNGTAGQALYIADTGAADPFRIKNGSWGCWFRCTSRGVTGQQTLMSKLQASGAYSWEIHITQQNGLWGAVSLIGTDFNAVGNISDPVDGRWHFVVVTFDSSRLLIYVDGILEGSRSLAGTIFGAAAPLNIGGRGADSGLNNQWPFFGRIDEAFVTSDVLSEEQIRNLYCAKVAHTLGSIPKRAGLTVRRRKRGAALVSGDFPTQPLRLYNFSAGALTDQGSNGQTLTNTNAAESVAGVDGSPGNAFNFKTASAQQLISTDTGLPSGTSSRSFGCWFMHPATINSPALISWGNGAGSANTALWISGGGVLLARTPASTDMTGLYVATGQWTFAVITEENAPTDGKKRKMYINGQLVADDATLGSITLGGANRFRIGHWPDGSGGGNAPFGGVIDSVFVCGYVLDPKEIAALYAKGSQALGVSPLNVGDHVEAMTATDLLCTFDMVPTQHQVDLVVA